MTTKLLLYGLTSALLFSSCAVTPPPTWNTKTGKPEVTLSGSNVQERVINRMISQGWDLDHQSNNKLIFTSDYNNSLYQALNGNSYSTSPKARTHILFLKSGSKTRVILTKIDVDMKSALGQQQGSVLKISQAKGDQFIEKMKGL